MYKKIFFFMNMFFNSFGYIPRSGVSGSCSNSVFNLLRHSQTVFKSGYTILQSHQQCMRVRFLHILPILLIVFLIIDITVGVKWYLKVVLICISLMTNNIKHLFLCLLTVCISSLQKRSLLICN